MRTMVNLFRYRWRPLALKEQPMVGSAVSGQARVLAASDKKPLREQGHPCIGTPCSQAECLTSSITVFSVSEKVKPQNSQFCGHFERMGTERTSNPASCSKNPP